MEFPKERVSLLIFLQKKKKKLCNARLPICVVGHVVTGIMVCSMISPSFVGVRTSLKIQNGRCKLMQRKIPGMLQNNYCWLRIETSVFFWWI